MPASVRLQPARVLALAVGALLAALAWRSPIAAGGAGTRAADEALADLKQAQRDQALLRAEITADLLRNLLASESEGAEHP